jgi:hypothetical protein
MIRVTVLFPKTNDSHFDMDYYLSKHVPMTTSRLQSLGIPVEAEVDAGLGSIPLGALAPYARLGICCSKKWKICRTAWRPMVLRLWLIFPISPTSSRRFRLEALSLGHKSHF